MRWDIAFVICATLIMSEVATGPELSAQNRYVGGHFEISVLFPEGGVGSSITAEAGIYQHVRIGLRWTDTNAFVSCAVYDAESECDADPALYEIGLRTGLGISDRISPFIGAGTGVYRRTWPRSRIGAAPGKPGRANSMFVSVTGGFDIALAKPLVLRASVVHQEVFDGELRGVYGHRVRLSGLSAGFGLATW
jgi:hypothetical protein